VNDTVIGNQSGISGVSKFGGQLGKLLAVSSDQIALMFSSAVGTLYAGVYQYVQLASNLGTPAPEIGQCLFWDTSEDPADFIVTDTKDETSIPTAAGVYIGGAEAGNYGFIQIAGIVKGLFGALTGGASTGQGLTVTAAGLFDNNTPVNPQYLGWAVELPVAHALKKVQLSNFLSLRG
jgi:hypothetical protein